MARNLVENCIAVLDLDDLARQGLLKGGATTQRVGSIILRLGVLNGEGQAPELLLGYDHGPAAIVSHFELVNALHPFGYARVFVLCGCGRCVRKLYLPSPGQRFSCRDCHGLAYTSSQTSHCQDTLASLLRRLAEDLPARGEADRLFRVASREEACRHH